MPKDETPQLTAADYQRLYGRGLDGQVLPAPSAALAAPGALLKVFYIEPMAKPRMTRRDAFTTVAPRPCVARYRAYANTLRLQAGRFHMPRENVHVRFFLPMPASWSEAKKRMHEGQLHRQKPDIDNLHKGLLDALCASDEDVADHRITKRWCRRSKERIEIWSL